MLKVSGRPPDHLGEQHAASVVPTGSQPAPVGVLRSAATVCCTGQGELGVGFSGGR